MDNLPYINNLPENEGEWFAALGALARYLRGHEGCPWDRKQTARSFASYLTEEVEELHEAMDSGDKAHAEEEFGDVLFCLIATAACAESEGLFTLENALRRAHEKMVRRHEHVFGEDRAGTAEDALASWNRIKARERKGSVE